MFLQWRNGALSIGPVPHVWGWGIELAWNKRELLTGKKPPLGEVIFADYKALVWMRGDWLPRYFNRSLPWGDP
jgi:hypothetical protein